MSALPAHLVPRLVLAALVAATLLACIGYRDPELMEWLGDLALCR